MCVNCDGCLWFLSDLVVKTLFVGQHKRVPLRVFVSVYWRKALSSCCPLILRVHSKL